MGEVLLFNAFWSIGNFGGLTERFENSKILKNSSDFLRNGAEHILRKSLLEDSFVSLD